MQLNEGLLPKDEKSLISTLLTCTEIPSKLVSSDTRSIEAGQIFLPLIGENFDGHNHIQEAFDKGAVMALSQIDPLKLNIDKASIAKVLMVKSTLGFLHKLANAYRNLVNPMVIAITGSSGKTTVKDILTMVVADSYRVHATSANHNNEIGLPKTILSMPLDTQVLVLEMGMRGLEQIKLLSQTAEPNIAIVTNVGTAHIELLGSRDNIKRAKLEIAHALRDYDGKAINRSLGRVLIVDEHLYQDLKIHNFLDPNTGEKINAELLSFDYKSSPELAANPGVLFSSGLRANFNLALLVGDLLGLDRRNILAALAAYKPGRGRGAYLIDNHGNVFIDETYNSNTEALKNSVSALIEQYPHDIKIAVIGDIKESERYLVDQCFADIKSLANDKFKVLDLRNKDADESHKLIKEALENLPGRKILLFKASRAVALDKVLDKFVNS